MKIVRVSNYNIESEAEYIVAENIKFQLQAHIMCEALNDHKLRSDTDWFVIKEDNYKPWRGMEELV